MDPISLPANYNMCQFLNLIYFFMISVVPINVVCSFCILLPRSLSLTILPGVKLGYQNKFTQKLFSLSNSATFQQLILLGFSFYGSDVIAETR